MKVSKLIISTILMCTISCENNHHKLGVEVITKIEDFRKNNHKLPLVLEEIGIKETESGPIYYELKNDSTYIIWYGLTLGESRTYNSATRKWD